MILLAYNAALITALAAASPWWLWKMATTHKYRLGLGRRLGAVPAELAALAAQGRPVIWLHAVSVGEVLAVSRLLHELEAALPGHQIVISTTTRTGQELAQDRFGAERVFYCPLDLPWATRAYLEALRPELLVLAETEFWPNLLSGCRRRGIPVAVVNARISDRSWPRYRKLRLLWRGFLRPLACVQAQTEADSERLRSLGCRNVQTAGNLKFDVRVPGETEATRQLQTARGALRLLVAGSTLEGEEAALLAAWPQLLEAHNDLAMVLAPRHPERFAAVAALLENSGMVWQRRSAWKNDAAIEPLQPGSIVLLDTIGELASVYSLAAVVFIGGSIVPAGGHNPLEPAQFAKAIVMGPHTHNFREMVDDLVAHRGLRIAQPVELTDVLLGLLSNPLEAEVMGYHALEVFRAQAGATGRAVKALAALLQSDGDR